MRAMLLLLATACTHQPPNAAVSTHATASISAVLAPAAGEATTSESDVLRDAIQQRMARHGLTASVGAHVHAGRSTEARLQLAADASTSDHIVIVEAEPVFVSQVAGRYRWKVGVTVTIAPREELSASRSWSWKIPVFLRFYHQREAWALDGAVPILQRDLDKALAEYLGT
ncbi:MAG: hypothetical protein ACI9MC_000969 [Kiritimatiellia bacterium]|jgi:hypothetical protein